MTTLAAPPFTAQTALDRITTIHDACQRRELEALVAQCSGDTRWHCGHDELRGREAIRAYLLRGWGRELLAIGQRTLWSWAGNRIAVCLETEWRDGAGDWFRTRGAELLEFTDTGLIARREMSAVDIPIDATERRFATPGGSVQ